MSALELVDALETLLSATAESELREEHDDEQPRLLLLLRLLASLQPTVADLSQAGDACVVVSRLAKPTCRASAAAREQAALVRAQWKAVLKGGAARSCSPAEPPGASSQRERQQAALQHSLARVQGDAALARELEQSLYGRVAADQTRDKQAKKARYVELCRALCSLLSESPLLQALLATRTLAVPEAVELVLDAPEGLERHPEDLLRAALQHELGREHAERR